MFNLRFSFWKLSNMSKFGDRITNLQKPPKKWGNAKIKKYHFQAIKIAQKLKGKNDYLDNRINKKIEQYKLYL